MTVNRTPSGRAERTKLSVVIPACDEAASIRSTLVELTAVLDDAGVDYEVIVVDDASTDGTGETVGLAAAENPRIQYHVSHNPPGFGYAVRSGLDAFRGEIVAIVMADGSDDPRDLLRYVEVIEQGFDCAFGSRFVPGATLVDYPRFKLVLNRVVNTAIRMLFRSGYNDTTNAFKAYHRDVIETVQPLFANHFNLTVELPLKAIVRGHSYGVVPITWRNRRAGDSKLSIQEMGSRYLFIVLYVFLEDHLSRGDYLRDEDEAGRRRGRPAAVARPR